MILVSKVLWGSATVAMLAGSAAVPGAADVALGFAAFFDSQPPGIGAKAAEPQVALHCAGACDVWAALAARR